MAMDWNNVVSSDEEEDIEDRGQEHHVRFCREQDMFHQEQCEVERLRSNFDKFGRFLIHLKGKNTKNMEF